MRHFLLLLVVVIVGYAAWNLADRAERTIALRGLTRHGIRLGAVILVLLALLLIATQLSSTSII